MAINLETLKNSPSFCLLPWLHLHVMPEGQVLPCCVFPYDQVMGEGKIQGLYEIYNSEVYKSLRQQMLKGQWPEPCRRCRQVEESGFLSTRKLNLKEFAHHLPLVLKTREDGSLSTLEFKYLDIRFSNVCNLKCRACGPDLSHLWKEDHEVLYQYKNPKPALRSLKNEAPSFWKDIKNALPQAEIIYFSGGEPLLSEEHWECLETLERLSLFDTFLSYNSNLTTLQFKGQSLINKWKKFKRINLGISLDDLGKRGEYFRHGSKTETILNNLRLIKKECPHIRLYINCTVSNMNILYLPEIFIALVDTGLIDKNNFDLNLLTEPQELQAKVLPTPLKMKVLKTLEKHVGELKAKDEDYSKAIRDFSNLISYLTPSEISPDLLENFKKRTMILDKQRGENFLKVYPELEELYLC